MNPKSRAFQSLKTEIVNIFQEISPENQRIFQKFLDVVGIRDDFRRYDGWITDWIHGPGERGAESWGACGWRGGLKKQLYIWKNLWAGAKKASSRPSQSKYTEYVVAGRCTQH